ncbi:hypothetical protein Btru_063616 [Bulinus truncatus]|nr:hypothetical protein Btru_063616 [Bulinus truncatus]
MKDVLQAYFKHNTSLINQSDPFCWTLLMHAVNTNNLHIVKILCGHGANANIIDAQNRNPLTMASEKGFLDITKILLTRTYDLNKVGINGMLALMHAAKRSQDKKTAPERDTSRYRLFVKFETKNESVNIQFCKNLAI